MNRGVCIGVLVFDKLFVYDIDDICDVDDDEFESDEEFIETSDIAGEGERIDIKALMVPVEF